MHLIERLDELPEEGAIELETTSAERKSIIAALENPSVVTMLIGRAGRHIWSTKLALGWQAPDEADLLDDEDGE